MSHAGTHREAETMLQKNRIHLISCAIAAVGLLAFASACGSDDADDGAAEPDKLCEDCAKPPEAPSEGAQGDGAGTTLAINKLFLGDTDRNGTPSTTAWKDYGYDLDGYKSTKNSVTHCKANGENGNQAYIQTDGYNGIDNAFGQKLLETIMIVEDKVTTKANETIGNGDFTVILHIEDIGTGTDYVNLSAALFAGAKLGSIPTWDGTDEWPVFCELMTDCQEKDTSQLPLNGGTNQSKVQFPDSYMAAGTWVSGTQKQISLSLAIAGHSLDLNINQAVITAKMSGGPPNKATDGIIAGVIETEEIISSLTDIAGGIHTSLCEGPMLETVSDGIRSASDIMKDGTQDANQVCDGISVGLGFEMLPVTLGTVQDKNPPGKNPCDN